MTFVYLCPFRTMPFLFLKQKSLYLGEIYRQRNVRSSMHVRSEKYIPYATETPIKIYNISITPEKI